VSYPCVCCVSAWYGARSPGVMSGARVPSLTRVAGHAQRYGRYGASRGGIRSKGDEGGESADGNVAPFLPASDSGNQARSVSSRSGRHARAAAVSLRAGKSLALGEQSGDDAGAAPARRVVGAPLDGVGVPATQHPHPPTRVRAWVSYEADHGICVMSDPASVEPCHELPGVGEGVCANVKSWVGGSSA
jgi:hypothetical protein